jgi:hypothetical protein
MIMLRRVLRLYTCPVVLMLLSCLNTVAIAQSAEKKDIRKPSLVVKTPDMSPKFLNHKGLLGDYQRYIESHYDVTYTTDKRAHADVLLVRGFEAPTQTYQDFFTLFYRRLTGSYTASVSPSYICSDDSSVKILYAKETWHSFPKGFDHCFDMILGYDQRPEDPKYLTVAGIAYDWFSEKVSTKYNPKKDVWRSSGCHPEGRKYDVCMLVSKRQERSSMDLALDRIALYKAFTKKTITASGGSVENNIGYTVPIGDELDWLMNCKFVISYENTTYPGYITEKPYEAWLAGAIPIYSAHRSVLRNINHEAVVFGPDYATNDEVVDRVVGLLEDRDAYCAIWQQPLHADDELNYDRQQAAVSKALIHITEQKLAKR